MKETLYLRMTNAYEFKCAHGLTKKWK